MLMLRVMVTLLLPLMPMLVPMQRVGADTDAYADDADNNADADTKG